MITKHYTYILYSKSHDCFYKGYTNDVIKRLDEHNGDRSRFTSGKGPWILIVVEEHPDKTTALKRELSLKKCKREYFEWLKEQTSNIAYHFG